MSVPVPDIGKRPRDDFTDALIREALDEEEQRKKAKKGEIPASVKAKAVKGQTLREIEDEEGGPVRESMVGMAAVQRALRRKKGQEDDDETGLPADIEAYEEEAGGQQQQRRGRLKGISEDVLAAMETDGGYAMTGFSMKQEREEGHIDQEGNYVPANEDDQEAQDAWLNSNEAQEASEKAKAAFAVRQAALAAADEAPALSETAVAAAQRDIAALLLPNETVTAGLRRLGVARKGAAAGKALGKREKQRLAAQAAAGGDKASLDVAAAERDFTKLTELADLLLNAGGELDVYSHRKEQLERWAAAVLPQTNVLEGGPDGNDDMFASDDETINKVAPAVQPTTAELKQQSAAHATQPAEPPAALSSSTPNALQPAAAPSATPAASPSDALVEYSSWPVKELRRYLTERGVDSSGIVEKEELINKVKAAAEQAAASAVAAPPGYSFDATSGYFHSPESGMYWDSKTGGFFNSADRKWYLYDAEAKEFKLWEQLQ